MITRILAENPGPWTQAGTNSYVVESASADGAIVVDPGPASPEHLRALVHEREISLILLSHEHDDHTEGASELARITGAPVRAIDPALCLNAAPLRDGELIQEAGARLTVIATPGHTDDSVSFLVEDRDTDGDLVQTILTGDTILGTGTTALEGGPTALSDYLESLRRLAAFGSIKALPGHGEPIADLRAVCHALTERRLRKVKQVMEVLADCELPVAVDEETVSIIAERVYGNAVHAPLKARLQTTRAQLHFLLAGGEVNEARPLIP